jgi:hypothetical protein
LQQIAGKPDDDEDLQTYINGVSQLVKTYCGNSFVDYFDTFKTEVFSIENAQSFVQLEETDEDWERDESVDERVQRVDFD